MACPGPRCHGRFGAARRAEALENASKVCTIIVTNDIQWHSLKNMNEPVYLSIYLSIHLHPGYDIQSKESVGSTIKSNNLGRDFGFSFHDPFVHIPSLLPE